ncbi:hypothetical protein IAQ61_001243 [Plenodomus lingam]|uniref:uncharacterized protein n=1 Tax=Leptosphaeria maculans TaxID=5022 RepID=UPI00332C5BF8|nr:hypothetical protein IAQ61_001243 [Plenodomus lingam]
MSYSCRERPNEIVNECARINSTLGQCKVQATACRVYDGLNGRRNGHKPFQSGGHNRSRKGTRPTTTNRPVEEKHRDSSIEAIVQNCENKDSGYEASIDLRMVDQHCLGGMKHVMTVMT